MNKTTQLKEEKSWNPQEYYEKINKQINEWPDWKKQAYNDIFAVSAHAKKLDIK